MLEIFCQEFFSANTCTTILQDGMVRFLITSASLMIVVAVIWGFNSLIERIEK